MNRRNFFKIFTLATLLVFAFVLGGCDSTIKDTSTAPAKKVRIGTLSIADGLPLFVAQEKGLFKEAGLDVEIIPFKTSSDESQALAAGEIDIAMNDMVVQILLKKAGTDTKVIAMALGATPQEGRFVIVGAPGKNITNVSQLKGRKLAISNNTLMDYLTYRYLHYGNVPVEDVTTVNMPNLLLRLETVLQGKDIDAAILPDPLAAMAIAKGCSIIVDDTTLPINASQSVVLASDKFIKEQPKEVKAFLTAYNKAIDAIDKNPKSYKELLAKIARVPNDLLDNYPVPVFTANALPTKEEVSALEDWLVAKKLLDKPYSYSDLVYKQ